MGLARGGSGDAGLVVIPSADFVKQYGDRVGLQIDGRPDSVDRINVLI